MKASNRFIKSITSLRLTVVCLVAAMILVFAGTLAQVKIGLYLAQTEYFRSFVITWSPLDSIPQDVNASELEGASALMKTVFVSFSGIWTFINHIGQGIQTLLQGVFGDGAEIPIFPGGYLIGTILLINLIASHIKRFKFTAGKSGIFLTHIGLILLLVGQLSTEILQEESYMRLIEGETQNYSDSYRDIELAVINTTDPETDEVIAFPQSYLEPGETLSHEKLPFEISLKEFSPNSQIDIRAPVANPAPASMQGLGRSFVTEPRPFDHTMQGMNIASAEVEIELPDGQKPTWLISTWFVQDDLVDYVSRQLQENPQLVSTFRTPQEFSVGENTYQIALRPKRYYKPFDVELVDFRHDVYPGTSKPKNFSSDILLTNEQTGEKEIPHRIKMNSPLRYNGETYFQASFDEMDPRVTVLQVVRNPSWLVPYISCSLVGLGLIIQFMISLIKSFKRKRA